MDSLYIPVSIVTVSRLWLQILQPRVGNSPSHNYMHG